MKIGRWSAGRFEKGIGQGAEGGEELKLARDDENDNTANTNMEENKKKKRKINLSCNNSVEQHGVGWHLRRVWSMTVGESMVLRNS